jgi:glycosyltransferase involved in cell wall biosynthesis
LRERFHRDLHDARVVSAGWRSLISEIASQLLGFRGWEATIKRNEAFEQLSVSAFQSNLRLEQCSGVFAYSYAAEKIFRYARERGLRTILGQIDAGPFAEQIYHDAEVKYSDLMPILHDPPNSYWEKWRRECSLADELVVNSEWTKTALISEGISESKIRIVPVAYETSIQTGATQTVGRVYPEKFSAARPLRVLFLGAICVRKGIGELLEAASLLRDENIEFVLVGPANIQMKVLESRSFSNVRWTGPVPRTEVAFHMAAADVFVFPTHSDGFGVVQLEAQASALPIIASRNCGNVVEDGQNGVLLKEISGHEIAKALSYLVSNPALLTQMSARAAQLAGAYSLGALWLKWEKIIQNINRNNVGE